MPLIKEYLTLADSLCHILFKSVKKQGNSQGRTHRGGGGGALTDRGLWWGLRGRDGYFVFPPSVSATFMIRTFRRPVKVCSYLFTITLIHLFKKRNPSKMCAFKGQHWLTRKPGYCIAISPGETVTLFPKGNALGTFNF